MSKVSERVAFTQAIRQLALLGRLGFPLAEGLKKMSSDASPWLGEMGEEMEKGDSLPQAMARFPRLFSDRFVAVVKAAEEAEDTPALLTEMSRWLERSESMRARLRQVLLYPLLIFNFLLLEIYVLLTYAVPQVLWPLAGQTQAAEKVASIETMGLGALILLAVVDIAIWQGAGDTLLRALVPGGGRLFMLTDQALWARSMGSLLAAGVELPRAAEMATEVVQHPATRAQLAPLKDKLASGSRLSEALANCQGLDPYLGWSTVAGEESEELAPILLRAADHIEKKVEVQAGYRIRLAEPWAILWLGILVTTIICLFWYPMYQRIGTLV